MVVVLPDQLGGIRRADVGAGSIEALARTPGETRSVQLLAIVQIGTRNAQGIDASRELLVRRQIAGVHCTEFDARTAESQSIGVLGIHGTQSPVCLEFRVIRPGCHGRVPIAGTGAIVIDVRLRLRRPGCCLSQRQQGGLRRHDGQTRPRQVRQARSRRYLVMRLLGSHFSLLGLRHVPPGNTTSIPTGSHFLEEQLESNNKEHRAMSCNDSRIMSWQTRASTSARSFSESSYPPLRGATLNADGSGPRTTAYRRQAGSVRL